MKYPPWRTQEEKYRPSICTETTLTRKTTGKWRNFNLDQMKIQDGELKTLERASEFRMDSTFYLRPLKLK